MPTIKLKTPAKINLILSIVSKRLDNFHEIETIFQAVNLFDIITVEYRESSDTSIKIKTNDPLVPTDSSNFAYMAAERFLAEINAKADIKINITKNIPVAAGMGGGSSDAACVLNALNKINFYPIKEAKINDIAYSIGADVNFFLKCNTAIGKGIGTILQPVATPNMDLVLVKPKALTVDTAWAYGKYDELSIKPIPKRIFDVLGAIEKNDIEALSKNMFNSLEIAVLKEYPELRQYKEMLIKSGCYNAMLSGSGPTIFGIAQNEGHAQELQNKMSSDELDVWAVKTISSVSKVS